MRFVSNPWLPAEAFHEAFDSNLCSLHARVNRGEIRRLEVDDAVRYKVPDNLVTGWHRSFELAERFQLALGTIYNRPQYDVFEKHLDGQMAWYRLVVPGELLEPDRLAFFVSPDTPRLKTPSGAVLYRPLTIDAPPPTFEL